MDWLILLAFLLGTALGSFANVVIFRMNNLNSLTSKRSHCPHCHHQLHWLDLIPILSFAGLGGRCRYCHKPISWQYPLVEATLGVLAVILALHYGVSVLFVLSLLVATALTVLFVYDLKTMRLPDVIVIPTFILALATYLVREGVDSMSIRKLAVGIAVGAGFLGVLYILGKGNWMGFGDVKLGAALGALVGWPVITATLALSFFLGALVAILLLLFRVRSVKDPIPFGPFLVLGAIVTLFWGKEIVSWYQKAFL